MKKPGFRSEGPLGVKTLGIFLILLTVLTWAASVRAEPPRVAVTIKPVHALTAAVMAEIGLPVLLMKSAASPHAFALRPSVARALDQADLVIWVGEGIETLLARPIGAIPPPTRTLALVNIPGLTIWPNRVPGLWRGDESESDRGDGHAHAHGSLDPHLWLDPGNAAIIARHLAKLLGDMDPDNAGAYRANAARMADELEALDADIAERLAPIRSKPFLVLHDAYQYLERRYGLNGIGAVAADPDRPPGMARIIALRDLAQAGAIDCAFAEPQSGGALLDTITEGTAVGRGTLDPLGVGIEPGPDSYNKIMDRLVAELTNCLGQRP